MNKSPLEDDECIVLVDWLTIKNIPFAKIPNETFTKSWRQKNKNKRLGVQSGIPDYVIFTPIGTIWIEMKRKKGGVISANQKEWLGIINKTPGTEAIVCLGAEEAIRYIEKIINNT